MSNPYTLVFGQPPMEIIGRTAQEERIISEFSSERPSNYLNLVTGIRGSGKTVFLTNIANRMREKKDWIVVNLNPQRDLLLSFAAKLNSDQHLSRLFQEAKINLQAFGIGVNIGGALPLQDIEEALIRMLRSVQSRKRKVLVTIDEVTNSRDMRIFASSYQLFLREKLPVFLLMTGLYKNIDRLRNADGMTFLERAPRTMLSPLSFNAMTDNYISTLGLKEDAATKLAKATKGYPFAFQTIGYFTYEYPDNNEKALAEAKDYLYEFAYWKIWSELSPKDREVVVAIAKVPSGNVFEVREKLNRSNNQFNPYRDRLLKAGVIHSPENGVVEFALPWFGQFALQARRTSEE